VIKLSQQWPKWQLLVVGDAKMSINWTLENTIYLSLDQQKQLGYEITKHIPVKMKIFH